MSDKKYWQSFAELKDEEGLKKMTKDEFREELPFGDLENENLLNAKTPRRDFLKYLGFSTAAATLAASCETPVRKAMPYVNRPENLVPGVPKYYASTYVQDGDVVPVVVKVRDGRPIKIEGNTLDPVTQGGTSPRAQASVLDLYDMYRLPHPKRKAGSNFQEIPTFDQLDSQMTAALAGVGGPVVLLTSTIVSPTTKQIIAQFLAKYPGGRHVQYDAVSYSGLIQANGGKIPFYQFDKAKVIVSLGADFLGTWLSPVDFARQYAATRRIDETNIQMSKHYQVESYLSMTGACADERFTHRPSEEGAAAVALLAAVGGGATSPQIDANLAKGLQKIANDLRANRGAALVVSGSNDPNVQAVVNEINRVIGAFGSTINTGITLNTRQGNDAAMVTLVNDMNNGSIGALLIYGANPAYDYFDADRFKAGLQKVRLTVSFNEKMDETTELCQYSVPTHHYLESWGDAEPRTGFISFIQPTINPLFKTRPFQTSLLKWSGNNTDYETFFRTYWMGRLGGQTGFDTALRDGVLRNGATATGGTPANAATNAVSATPAASGGTSTGTAQTNQPAVAPPPPPTPAPTAAAPNVTAAVAAIGSRRKGGGTEIILYQNVGVLTGKQSGNPWLLELPDPITRATWDNYAVISTIKAKQLGIDYESTDFEYYQDRPTIELAVGNRKVTLPIMVVPGMDPNTIAVAVGYGRSEKFAKAVSGVGQNVFQFARFNGSTIDYHNDVTTSAKAVGTYKVARVQMHNTYEGRTEVVKETSLATFKKFPNDFKEFREELKKDFGAQSGDYRKEGTLYGDYAQPGAKWGMAIDLNTCIGCGACVVACHLENNVPVVGKNEVLRAHEMHWMRIDRYFVTEDKSPDQLKAVVFQPMLCQHCDNAPCENVCPVAATMHNSEGVNQMAYNRCIGTRYCANNCPYKVRRFNWGDYTGASTHGKLGPSSGVGELNPVVNQMNDELTRMVLNPDVVTRSRGVMEKCSFCVQRTQAGKLQAKAENRPLGGDEVVTACAQACPTSAITFGNANDPTSSISKLRQSKQLRLFYVLEQLHTLPNVSYLARIRNTDEIVEREAGMEEQSYQSKEEQAIPSQHEPAKEGNQ
ncbi:MAG: TAT-variant-translocated molybdopterin oxidoreductase [Candidatus Dadabacteria bacterium]